jgi:hypothetical protein
VLDFSLVCGRILFEEVIGLGLGRGFRVWIIQKSLDAQQDLLDGDCRLPAFFFV